MYRSVSMVLLIATIFGMLAMLVAQGAGAASAVTQGSAPATSRSDTDALEYERAPVTLDGQVLFEVRGIPAYPAEERVKTIKQRIEEIAADRSAAIESLRVGEMADRTRIMAGDRLPGGLCRCRCRGGGYVAANSGRKRADKNQSGDRFLPQ
jgi:hypothetical protein